MYNYTFVVCLTDGSIVHMVSWTQDIFIDQEGLSKLSEFYLTEGRMLVGTCSESLGFDLIRPHYVIIRSGENG